MPNLNQADNIKLGSTTVDKVYLGSEQVWPSSILGSALAAWSAGTYSGSGDLLDLGSGGHDLTISGATFDTDHFIFEGNASTAHYLTSATRPDLGTNDFTVVVVYQLDTWAGTDAGSIYLVDGTNFFDQEGFNIWTTATQMVGDVWYFDTIASNLVTKDGADTGFSTYALRAPYDPLFVDEMSLYVNGTVADNSNGGGYEDSIDGGTGGIRFGRGSPTGTKFYGAAIFDRLLTDEEIAQVAEELGYVEPLVESAMAAWKAADYPGSGALNDLTGNGFDLTVDDATFSTDHFVSTSFDAMLRRTGPPQVGDGPWTAVAVFSEIDGDAGTAFDVNDDYAAGFGWRLDINGADLSPVYTAQDGTPDEYLFCAMPGSFSGKKTYAARFGPSEVVGVTEDGVCADPGPGLSTGNNFDGATELKIGSAFGAGYFFYGAAIFDRLLTDEEIAQVGTELGA